MDILTSGAPLYGFRCIFALSSLYNLVRYSILTCLRSLDKGAATVSFPFFSVGAERGGVRYFKLQHPLRENNAPGLNMPRYSTNTIGKQNITINIILSRASLHASSCIYPGAHQGLSKKHIISFTKSVHELQQLSDKTSQKATAKRGRGKEGITERLDVAETV
jgi:hypothetical protein